MLEQELSLEAAAQRPSVLEGTLAHWVGACDVNCSRLWMRSGKKNCWLNPI